jgi:hypothetical protein
LKFENYKVKLFKTLKLWSPIFEML